MKRDIRHIYIGVGGREPIAYIHRGDFKMGNSSCRLYSNVTLSSLRRAQRAQLALLAKGTNP